jgi:flagellar assembly protein FliH
MPLIKADDAKLAQDVVVLDLADLERQSQHILERAHERAREAYQKGYAEGRAAGCEDAMRQAAESLERLQSAWLEALHDFEQQRQSLIAEAQQSLVQLAIALARRIVHRLPRMDSTVVTEQVAEALRHVLHERNPTVHLHPADRPIVERCLPRLAVALGGSWEIRLEEDPAIEPGGCIVTAGSARIDATLDTQVRRMAELLLPECIRGLEAA